ncbi:hypothetical protein MLD38_036766 [Melastoma candidum]|uniref:Uncharacterized protein n=1 Tax=Melastoma candidum TaxID=119954 RepID=A0ACB9LL36_9MYRT|nr:hypothetical protein MLD38_036766 [Melastoma candidum]
MEMSLGAACYWMKGNTGDGILHGEVITPAGDVGWSWSDAAEQFAVVAAVAADVSVGSAAQLEVSANGVGVIVRDECRRCCYVQESQRLSQLENRSRGDGSSDRGPSMNR